MAVILCYGDSNTHGTKPLKEVGKLERHGPGNRWPDVMADALARVDVSAPEVPLVATVLAEAVTDPARIRELLVEQVTGSVRWRESVAWMGAEGVTEMWEIGAGKALSGMVRRINRDIACAAVGTPDDIAKLKTA